MYSAQRPRWTCERDAHHRFQAQAVGCKRIFASLTEESYVCQRGFFIICLHALVAAYENE